jgi:hypothetical protein
LEKPKPLGIALVAFTISILYLGLANLLFFVRILDLPLGAAVDPFIVPLVVIDVSVVNLYVYAMRRHGKVAGPE